MTIPLFFWLIFQLIAIALAASRIELWANYPRPAESVALHVLICAQMFFAALLSPLLFSHWKSALSVITSSIVFVLLAGFLSFQSLPVIALTSLYLTIWLLALGLCSARVKSNAVLTIVTILGILLWYLRSEFVGAIDYRTFAPFNPILGIFSQIEAERFLGQMWILPLGIACFGAALLRFKHTPLLK